MKERIVLATNNAGKLTEFRQIFSRYAICGLKEAGIHFEVIEDSNTFIGNALKKATEIYNFVKLPVIADDSGIEIATLNGFPGVMTHRFLGDATDAERNAELIRRAAGETVRFVCELVYFDGTKTKFGHGELIGKIAQSPRGNNGFGFDPIFELSNGRTLAELPPGEKNKLSARRLAATDLVSKL